MALSDRLHLQNSAVTVADEADKRDSFTARSCVERRLRP